MSCATLVFIRRALRVAQRWRVADFLCADSSTPRAAARWLLVCRAVQQCDKRKKVTLTPDDIVEALREAEFEDFEQPMKEALAQFRNGGPGAAKKGGSSAKKQKLDDSTNGADTPTRAEPDTKEGEDDAEDDAEPEGEGAAADGLAAGDEEEMEDDDDEGKDDEDQAKNEPKHASNDETKDEDKTGAAEESKT